MSSKTASIEDVVGSETGAVEQDLIMEPKEDPEKCQLLTAIGVAGRWQVFFFLYLSLVVAWDAPHMFNMKFTAYQVDFRCDSAGFVNETANGFPPENRCFQDDLDNTSAVVKCQSWTYDTSHFENTVMQRFNLVCGPTEHLPRFAQTMFFCGNLAGIMVCGWLADRFGRLPIILASISLTSIASMVGALAPNITVWIIVRFFVGASTLSMNTSVRVFISECTNADLRPFVATINNMFCQIGVMLFTLMVYLMTDMQQMELIVGLMGAVFLPLFFILPESPKWLIAKGRINEANSVIKHICRWNNRPFDGLQVEALPQQEPQKSQGNVFDILKYPGMRRNLISMCIAWFAFSMGYYGMMYNNPASQDNVYLVFMMPAFGGMVNVVINPILQRKFGRKIMLTGPLLLAGILINVAAFGIPKHYSYAMTTLSIIGTTVCNAAFDTGYMFVPELFPTVVRTSAVSAASSSARIGSLLTPLIAILDRFDRNLPVAVYGVVVLIAGLQSIIIWPETNKLEMTDTFEEGEKRAMSRNRWLHFCSKKDKTNKPCEDKNLRLEIYTAE